MDEETGKIAVKSDGFDYTEWQRGLFADMSLEELTEKAVAFEKAHSHEGKGKRS